MWKQLRKLWNLICTVETIQSIIQWIGISKIIGAGGTFAVMIWSVFEHKPTPEIIIISIATFATLLWLSNLLLGLWKHRNSSSPLKNERGQIADGDVGWWTTLADGDRKDIKHRVPLRDAYDGIELVKKTGYCCIHFVFVFINATVYTVNVRQVNGDIYADGMKLPNKLGIDMKEEELVFGHGIGFGLRCSLLINEPYLEELVKLSGKTVLFELERIDIMADLIDPVGKRAGEFRLEIPHRIVFDVPNLATDQRLELRKVDLSRK